MSTNQAETAEKLLDDIEKSLFDCADAIQNALGSTSDKAKEYLSSDWLPAWMVQDTFTIDRVGEKSGTDKVRVYIRTLEAENKLLREEWERMREELEFDLQIFMAHAMNSAAFGKSAKRVADFLHALKFSPSQK